jgi:ferric-dicitrate binding protein FerR (iron transport regulator)
MNEHCEAVREWLPELTAGLLEAERAATIERHLDSCAECSQELRLLTLLRQARPEPPTHLAAGIKIAVATRPTRTTRPWWGLAAAAVAAVALGIGVRPSISDGPGLVPSYVAANGDDELWLGDDGTIAGAPALEGLSTEELQALLDEISTGGSG